MKVLPPEDALELFERHAAVDLLILGRLPVLLEGLMPLRLSERRYGADDRLPLDDRQAGMREARDAADHHHREHERATQKQPGCDGRARYTSGVRVGRGRQRHRMFHGADCKRARSTAAADLPET